jgi:nucleotide-binding universal stress UspA family protein
MKTILLAYEERPVAPRVVERTVQLAKALGAKVIVTSVAPILLTKGQGPWDPADPPSRHREEVDHAAARLAELGVQGVETVVTGGDPAHAIVELADERKADLIVLGAHDGGLVSRLLEGSVGDAVPSSFTISSRSVRLDVPMRVSAVRTSTASSSWVSSRRKSIATRTRT